MAMSGDLQNAMSGWWAQQQAAQAAQNAWPYGTGLAQAGGLGDLARQSNYVEAARPKRDELILLTEEN